MSSDMHTMLPTKQLVAPLTIKCLARFPGDADLRLNLKRTFGECVTI